MKIDADCEFLFRQRPAARYLNRKRLPKPNALFPMGLDSNPPRTKDGYLYSMDPRALRLTERLAERASREFPKDVRADGFAGATGVPGDFWSLLNVSGYGMDPLPIPVTHNAELIKANGLMDHIRPEDGPWLKELIKLFFGHAAPANLHIRKEASTCFPYFEKDIQYKKLGTLKALHQIDKFLELATGDSSDLLDLVNEYHAIFLFAIQERQQPNAVLIGPKGEKYSKPRTTPSEAEARTGSYSGETKANMTIKDAHGNIIQDHFRMRRRDVFGGNGIINYTLTAIINCFREVYLSRFAFTYKTRDRFDKQKKIASYAYVIGSDVKTMDKMCPEWFMTFVFDELKHYLDERVVEVMRRKFQAPYVVPPPWEETAESYNPVFGGSPLNPDNFKQHVGLPSGIAFNPDWGKLWMTFVYAILYRDVGALHRPSDLEPFLRGLNPQHALLDMSDDAAFLTNSAIVAKRLRTPVSPYAVLEVETPVIFLGDVFCSVNDRKEVYPNPITYLVNALCREDSIDREPGISDQRKPPQIWAEGYLARYQVYSSSPIFRDLNAMLNEECRREVGINPYLLACTLAKQQKFNDIDAMVRANPGVLHYKVDPKDVSPDVLNDIVATIPAQDFFRQIRHLFKVPTTNLEEFSNG